MDAEHGNASNYTNAGDGPQIPLFTEILFDEDGQASTKDHDNNGVQSIWTKSCRKHFTDQSRGEIITSTRRNGAANSDTATSTHQDIIMGDNNIRSHLLDNKTDFLGEWPVKSTEYSYKARTQLEFLTLHQLLKPKIVKTRERHAINNPVGKP